MANSFNDGVGDGNGDDGDDVDDGWMKIKKNYRALVIEIQGTLPRTTLWEVIPSPTFACDTHIFTPQIAISMKVELSSSSLYFSCFRFLMWSLHLINWTRCRNFPGALSSGSGAATHRHRLTCQWVGENQHVNNVKLPPSVSLHCSP